LFAICKRLKLKQAVINSGFQASETAVFRCVKKI